MRNILAVFATNSGIIARWLTGIIMAGIAASIAHLGLELSDSVTLEIAAFVGMLTAATISEVILWVRNKYVTEMQEAVTVIAPEVRVDGDAGPITTAAVVRAVEHLQDIKMAGTNGTAEDKAAATAVRVAMKPE